MTPLLAAFPMMAAVLQGATALKTPIVWLLVAIALSKPVRSVMAIARSLVRTMMPALPMCFRVLQVHVTSPAPTLISINVCTVTVAVLPAATISTMMIALRSVEIMLSKRVNIVKARVAHPTALI